MNDEWSKLSNVVGAKEATRILEQRRLDSEALRDDAMQAPLADHGISPAQPSERALVMLERATSAARAEANHHAIRELREKVEALEAKYQGICEHGDELEKRLDAALKRIELLERDMNDVHPNALSGDKP